MAKEMQFQIGQQGFRLDVGEGVRVWHLSSGNAPPVCDVVAAVQTAVSAPIGFPSLASAVVPGDRVVISADADIPQLPTILSGLVQSLRTQPVEIAILLGETAHESGLKAIRLAVGENVEVLRHDPDTREQLAYLAANEAADPIYLNRRLLDADLVLPVILARGKGPLDPDPLGGHVFPQFADRQSQLRDRAHWMNPAAKPQETLEAAWLLGLQLMIVVAPADGNSVAEIVAGTTSTLKKWMEERFSASAASHPGESNPTPDLVIACVDGDEQQQTWDNVARAVAAAQKRVRPGGVVAVCSTLADSPGPALRRLKSDLNPERTLQKLRQDQHADALMAAVLLKCRGEGRVLLQTELASETVEDLGFGVIDGLDGLARLIRQSGNCAIMNSAQFSNYLDS